MARGPHLRLGLLTLGLLAAGFAAPPRADERGGVALAHSWPVQAQTAAPCTCRAQGRVFGLGETICLRTAEGPRLAQCVMEINVTSWRFADQPCPES